MKPMKKHTVTTITLGKWQIGGGTVTQSQSGLASLFSIDFREAVGRVDRDGTGYMIGYLSHEEAAQLGKLLTEQAI